MRRLALLILLVLAVSAALGATTANADTPTPGDAQQQPSQDDGSGAGNGSDKSSSDGKKDDGGKCPVPLPGIAGKACDAASGAAKGAVDTVTGAPGKVAGAVAGSVLDQMTKWMTDAATWTTKQIAQAIQRTTTPELGAGWYRERFASMAALGLGLSLLVAMLALGSAAIRRDPEALGATFVGMFRAGLGTGLVLALTVMALGVADGGHQRGGGRRGGPERVEVLGRRRWRLGEGQLRRVRLVGDRVLVRVHSGDCGDRGVA